MAKYFLIPLSIVCGATSFLLLDSLPFISVALGFTAGGFAALSIME